MPKLRINYLLLALLGGALLLAGCGTAATAVSSPVPEPTATNPAPAPTETLVMPTDVPATPMAPTPTTASSGNIAYPAFGHADDFAWIAGKVNVTKIQGGCTYLSYGQDASAEQIYMDGDGWSAAATAGVAKNGAFVVVFGHRAGPTEPHQMCPGQAYLVDRVQDNAGAPGSEIIPPAGTPTASPTGNGIIVGTSVPGGGPVEGPPLRDIPTPTARPTTPLTPDATGLITVTEADNGRTAEMHLGDTLKLNLKADNGYTWTITLSDPAILNQDSSVTSTGGQEKYAALHTGQTTVIGVGQLPCHKVSPPCEAPTLGFTLQVIVR